MVEFRQFNLLHGYEGLGTFDAIFCRNVLIYFGAEARGQALSALLRRLPPTGHLFLGHAESLTGSAEPARCVAPNIYCAKASAAPGASAT